MKQHISILLYFFLASLCHKTHAQGETEISKSLEVLEKGTHIEIGIFHNGEISRLAYEIEKERIEKVEASPDKIFEIGSITKVFTSYIVHSVLFEKQGIDLQSKLKDMELSFPIHHKNESRILHLINHTSNLPKMPSNYIWGMIKSPANPYLIYDKKRISKYYKSHKTKHSLGTATKYSNFGYGILGLMLTDLTGKTYRELFEAYISNGLGMKNSQSGITESGKSKLYRSPEQVEDCLWQLNQMECEGGGYSSVNDLLKFTQYVLDKSQLDQKSKTALSAMENETIKINEERSIGTGWMIQYQDGRKILFHDGGSKGYKSFVAIDIERNKSVVLLSKNCGLNKNSYLLKKIGLDIISSN